MLVSTEASPQEARVDGAVLNVRVATLPASVRRGVEALLLSGMRWHRETAVRARGAHVLDVPQGVHLHTDAALQLLGALLFA